MALMSFHRMVGVGLAANWMSAALGSELDAVAHEVAEVAEEVEVEPTSAVVTSNDTELELAEIAQFAASAAASAGGFAHEEALELAYLVTAAYCDGLEDWTCGEACDQVSRVHQARVVEAPSVGVRALVGHRNGACLVAFRGTRDFAGWKMDLQSAKLVPKSGCFHNGQQCRVSTSFEQQYWAVEPQLKAAMKDLDCYRGEPIDLAGHSMGGAMAMLMAFDLAKQGHNLRHLYSFGGPRVGDGVFAEAFRSTLGGNTFFRVTRGDDPFVLMPSSWRGFTHAGVEVYYRGSVSEGLRICWASEDSDCSRSQRVKFAANLLKCAVPSWCGHYLYMHDTKQNLMSHRACSRRLSPVGAADDQEILLP